MLCQKMDDDDWYAPGFVQAMVSATLESWKSAVRPTLVCLTPFLFFDMARWEVRRSIENHIPGATLMFSRDCWENRRFRGVRSDEDTWFFMDQVHEATSVLRVRSPEMFLVVRHRGSAGALDHTWVRQATGQSLEEYLTGLPVFAPGPEALLPKWALTAYRRIQSELLAAGNNHDETGVGVVGNDPHAL